MINNIFFGTNKKYSGMTEKQNNIQLYRTRKIFFLIEIFIKYFFLSVGILSPIRSTAIR